MTAGAQIGRVEYDGLGRRVRKTVSNSGDWDMTQRFLFDGWRIAEVRDGGNALLQQYVWGTQYIDELVQIRVAPCPLLGGVAYGSHAFAVCQDANYNVLGVVVPDAAGVPGDSVLVERYEYTPYGRRTPYASGLWWQSDWDTSGEVNSADLFYESLLDMPVSEGCLADADGSGDVNSADNFYPDFLLGSSIPVQPSPLVVGRIDTYGGLATLGGPISPLGLCPFGHQGLFEDREWGQIYNRMRQGQPGFMRWGQPDPVGRYETAGAGHGGRQFSDGMDLYQYVKGGPTNNVDPEGLACQAKGGWALLLRYQAIADLDKRAEGSSPFAAERDRILQFFANYPDKVNWDFRSTGPQLQTLEVDNVKVAWAAWLFFWTIDVCNPKDCEVSIVERIRIIEWPSSLRATPASAPASAPASKPASGPAPEDGAWTEPHCTPVTARLRDPNGGHTHMLVVGDAPSQVSFLGGARGVRHVYRVVEQRVSLEDRESRKVVAEESWTFRIGVDAHGVLYAR